MIVTITGQSSFGAYQKLNQLKQAFVEAFGTSCLVDVDGEEATIDQVRQSVMSQGLFSTDSFVILRDVAKNKILQEGLVALLEDVPSEARLVIFDTNLDRRTTFFKSLKKGTDFIDCAVGDERELVQWTRDQFKEAGKELEFSEAQFLVQRVNADQWLLSNEIQKLANLDQKITKKVIEDMVDESFTESIFNLLDDAFSKRADKASAYYREMIANRVEAHYIFSMLVWQLHILLLVAHANGLAAEQIAKENKISPFVVQKTMAIYRKTSKNEIKAIVEKAAKIDLDSKTKAGYKMDVAVDILIARIAG